MTATTMLPRSPEVLRRFMGRLVLGVIGALGPKCVLCLSAYLGFGTALGRIGVELCGAPGDDTLHLVAWLVVSSARCEIQLADVDPRRRRGLSPTATGLRHFLPAPRMIQPSRASGVAGPRPDPPRGEPFLD